MTAQTTSLLCMLVLFIGVAYPQSAPRTASAVFLEKVRAYLNRYR